MFDGTMTWAPFVKQTLAMVRDHRHNYRRGPGYTSDDCGHTVELCALTLPHPGLPCPGTLFCPEAGCDDLELRCCAAGKTWAVRAVIASSTDRRRPHIQAVHFPPTLGCKPSQARAAFVGPLMERPAMQDSGSAGEALPVVWPVSAWRVPSSSFSCALDVMGGRGARYWEVDDSQPPTTPKLPYRIELVGVTCDPGLAVARGIWCAPTWWPCSAESRGCNRARPPVWAGHSSFWGQKSITPLATVRLPRSAARRHRGLPAASSRGLPAASVAPDCRLCMTSARVCDCFFSVMHSFCSWCLRMLVWLAYCPELVGVACVPKLAVARGTCVLNPVRAGGAPYRSCVSAWTGGRSSDLPVNSAV